MNMKYNIKVFIFLLITFLLFPISYINADNLSSKLTGKILLQVEQNGEAWYINPADEKRYYMGRPTDAFSLMRELGLGITHNELTQYLNSKFPTRLSGKIMLDVEENGEAYYIYPNDLKGYFLGRPADAFQIMRNLGLGITDSNLELISSGSEVEVSKEQESKNEEVDEVEKKPTEEGLIVHWNFDEGEGNTLGDSSGNNISGAINGATWIEGVSGQALDFDGADDYVEINSTGLSTVGDLEYGTISLWFKFNKVGEKTFLPILYLGEAESESKVDNLVIEIGHYDHGDSPNTRIYYTLYNDYFEPFLCFDSNESLEENIWYHFAVVNSEFGNTGYLNGVELINRYYNFNNSSDTRFFNDITNKEIFRLGHGWFGIDQEFHYFNGSLDEIKIYNRALEVEEILEITNL